MEAAASQLGDPQDPRTTLGPLADAASFDKVQAMIEQGKTEAELVVGGARHGPDGCFMKPAVFLHPKPDAEIYKTEVFGPVAVIRTFETEEEVLRLANDTEYGLMAGVFTRDINRALRVSSKIDSGVCGINCISQMSIQVPFGGRKSSGIGREFGEYVSFQLLLTEASCWSVFNQRRLTSGVCNRPCDLSQSQRRC
jgi:aldehyde dehydrogenase (NAD+)/retinal dehydrogenase